MIVNHKDYNQYYHVVFEYIKEYRILGYYSVYEKTLNTKIWNIL